MAKKTARWVTEKATSDPISHYGWDISINILGEVKETDAVAEIIDTELRIAWRKALTKIHKNKMPVETREEYWE